MKLSRRINNISTSAAIELDRQLALMRENDEKIISFNAGQPDFETPVNIVEACNLAIAAGKTKYTSINGIVELRRSICKKLYEDNGVLYTPEDIVVCTGAKQALFNIIQVLIDVDDEVIIPTPAWVSYTEMVKLAQGKPVHVPVKPDFHLDLDAVAKAISCRTKAIIINTPNNPTGAVYTEDELTELADIALKNDLFIISDEVYEKLTYDGHKHFCIASLSEKVKEHCVIINGFSKAFSMTGWRIGYCASSPEIAKAVCSIQSHTTSNSTTFVQWAAVQALEGRQDSVEMMRLEFQKRRNFLFKRLQDIPGFKCEMPEGAFYMFADVSGLFGKHTPDGTLIDSSEAFCKYILTATHVALLPGTAFDAPGFIRIAYSTSEENIRKGFDLICEAVGNLH